jgi:archaellum biogenesis protein FlaJ (TadC family)
LWGEKEINEMKLNSSYKIVIEIDGRTLTYTGKVIQEDDMFLTFIDKFGKTYSYNKNKIVSAEELQ